MNILKISEILNLTFWPRYVLDICTGQKQGDPHLEVIHLHQFQPWFKFHQRKAYPKRLH